MKFVKQKGWKHPTKTENSEKFIGVMRAELTPEVEDFLKPMLPVKTINRDGMRIQYFQDGHVEIESYYSILSRMAKEIKERDEQRLF